MKYRVVNAVAPKTHPDSTLHKSFDEKINELLAQGWRPLGSLAISMNDSSICYAQAMIREGEDDEEKVG
jgi:hypothetical protein